MQWPGWSVVAGIVAGLATGMLAIIQAAQIGEPHWLTSRGWVRTEIKLAADATQKTLNSLEDRQVKMQIFIANDSRRKLESEIANRQVLLQNTPTMPPEVRRLLEDQVRDMNADLAAAKREIERLERDDAGRAR